MIVVGTGGHAVEVLQVLAENGVAPQCAFYHDLPTEVPAPFRAYRVIRSLAEAERELRSDRRVVLAVGSPRARRRLATALVDLGGRLEEVRAGTARVSPFGVELGPGLNVMHGVLVSPGARVGEGTLLNAACHVHHGATVGRWVEVGPRALLLGDARVDDEASIGAGAIVLPRVGVGARVVVGAGSVVTRDVPAGLTVTGVPARPMRAAVGA